MKETHLLERAEAKTIQDTERRCASKGNSLAEGGKGQDWSEHKNNASREHSQPEVVKVRIGQVTEEKKSYEGHSLSEEGRVQDWLE